ncbi:MAG: exodeoxyribonuclease III [Actinomycetota bacterium]|nr:exodeoxyribonuclease III [Actinomycetota bacterium]
MPRPLRIATINVNGIRAAFRKGMGDWLEASGADIVAMQEVRATTEDVEALLGAEWDILHDAATAKGRAGVAIASRHRAHIHRVSLGADDFDSAGRWLEADYDVDGAIVTVVSTYVHSGSEVNEAKQTEKYKFLDAMETRLPEIERHNPRAVVLGDLNVGHTKLDIKNWKGNVKNAGFLPRERAYFDRFFGPKGETVTGTDGSEGTGLGWVDVGRRLSGEVDGPWTWWSMRGKAYDTDTGWRLDYHVATPALADTARNYRIDRAPSWDTRWSDHAPVTVDYEL